MTTLLYARILGEPVGKGRPRASIIAGHVHMRTPEVTRTWEGNAAFALREAWGAQGPLARDVAVRCAVFAVATRPKSRDRKRDPSGRMWRTSKPDGDNVLKAALDSLQMAGVVTDDKQVAHAEVRSFYAARGEGPCVELWMWSLDADDAGEQVG